MKLENTVAQNKMYIA